MKPSRTTFLLPVVAAGGLLLGGCGASVSVGSITVDHEKAQKMLVDGFHGGTVKPKSASCPKGVDAEKGGTFTCTVSFDDGATAKVTVHMTSDEGDIKFGPDDVTEPK